MQDSIRFFPHWTQPHSPASITQVTGYLSLVNHVCGALSTVGRWVDVSSGYGEAATLLLGFPAIKSVACVAQSHHHAGVLRKKFAREIAAGRCTIHVGDAAGEFGPDSVDVVYLDSAKDGKSLRAAFAAWRTALKQTGYLCGHDYSPAWPDVVATVDAALGRPTVYADSSWLVPATANAPARRGTSGLPTVAIITPCLGLGGAEMWIRSLVSGCTGFAWRVCSLTAEHAHPLITNAIADVAELHSVGRGLHGSAVAHDDQQSAVAEAIRGADAVIAWGSGDYWPLDTSAPVIFVGHGSCQWTLASTAAAIRGGATRFVGVSPAAAEAMRTLTPDVGVILNGVDTSRFASPADRLAVRRQWRPHGCDYDRYVGYMGRLSEEKNVDSIVHAIAQLPFLFKFVLIGCTGLSRDRVLTLARTVLSARVIELPATDAVDVPLGGLDCLVQVSPREGHSLSLCEAMLCRVPIVSNMTGALPTLERMAGRDLVERVPDEPTAGEIAEAIRRVCSSPPADRVDAAYGFASRHLTADVMCQRWSDCLTREIGRGP